MQRGPGKGMPGVLVVHGPNLNLLGEREPQVYGFTTLAEIDADLGNHGKALGLRISCFQSNHEGALIDRLHQARRDGESGLIINAGGYTHTSVALRDAVSALAIPSIEVHLSNLYKREAFRHQSFLAPVCLGQIAGLGAIGYRLALDALARILLVGEDPQPPSQSMIERSRFPKSPRAISPVKKGVAKK
jgi:3-dehydroquinate dehydratase-2